MLLSVCSGPILVGFILKGDKLSNDYALKILLNSEWTLYRIGNKVSKTLLIPKRQQNKNEEKNSSLTQVGEKRKRIVDD